MKKYILFFIALLLVGCTTKTEVLNEENGYKELIGKRYKMAQDFVLYRSSNTLSERISVDFYGEEGIPEKEEMKKEFPFRYQSNIIYGELSKGSVIEIVKIEREKTFESSYLNIWAERVHDPKEEFEIFDVRLLTTGLASEPPIFTEKYAIEVK